MSVQLFLHYRGAETASLQTSSLKGKAPTFLLVAPKQPQQLRGAGVGVIGVRLREQFDSQNTKTICKKFLIQVLPWESQPGHFRWRFVTSPQIWLFTLLSTQQGYLLSAFPPWTMEIQQSLTDIFQVLGCKLSDEESP